MAEVAELKDTIPALEAEEKKPPTELGRTESSRKSPTCRSTTCRTARTSTAMSSTIIFGAKRDYAFTPKQHFELGEALGQMDFETAAKLSGRALRRFAEGPGADGTRARAVHARCAYGREHGYTEVNPPLLVRDDAMFGTAQLPKFEEDQFSFHEFRKVQHEFAARDDCGIPKRPENWIGSAIPDETPTQGVGLSSTLKTAEFQFKTADKVNRSQPLAHPHRRSPADQSRPRIHPRRSRAAAALHRLHAVLPRRSRRRRPATRAA